MINPSNEFAATPKESRKEAIVKELKRNVPFAAMGIGAGAGLALNQKDADTFIEKQMPNIKKAIKPGTKLEGFAKGFNKFRKGSVAAMALPIALSSAGYLAGKVGTGQKISKEDLAVLGSSAGATGATGLIEKKLQGKNPLLSRTVGSLGSIASGVIAASLANKKAGGTE